MRENPYSGTFYAAKVILKSFVFGVFTLCIQLLVHRCIRTEWNIYSGAVELFLQKYTRIQGCIKSKVDRPV